MSLLPQNRRARLLPQPIAFVAADHPNLIFWLSFFALNGLLFLPLYLFNLEISSFLPVDGIAGQPVRTTARQLFRWRNNLDIFRLNLEVVFLAALWVNVRWLWRDRQRRFYRTLFFLLYVLALSYAVYESISLSLYQVEPVFYSQYRMAVDGIPFVMAHLHVPLSLYLGGGLVLIALIFFLLRLSHWLIGGAPPERLSLWTRLAMALLAFWAILSTLVFGSALASPKSTISSLAFKLEKNIADSLALHQKIVALDGSAPQRVYDYSRYDLLRKPDIYLIFVESYGSVLYKRPDWRAAYEELLAELEQELASSGWYAASALSESPTWGGGSWMAYTSALFGMRIDNHAEYLALLEEYQDAAYPDLGRYLQSQGYHSLRVSSISSELPSSAWLKYLRFYGLDEWLQYGQLDYQGPRYGWGPAPPDQYVLWYAYQEAVQKLDQPVFLFYITQNSHYPWVPQPELVEDWRTLNQPAKDPAAPLPDQIPHQAKRRNYFTAIDYQLRFLIDFILKTGDDNALYVLIGDHQPQQVSRKEDGFETPVHIISRDSGFVETLRVDYGFLPGLAVDEIEPVMRHEGFYSLFVRALLANYGQAVKVLPDYLPEGIVLEESQAAGP